MVEIKKEERGIKMEKENCFDFNLVDLSKSAKIVETFLIAIGALLTPFIVPQLLEVIFGKTSFIATNSQYVVGTIVNIALIFAGINLKGYKKILGIITLPSISAICSGFIFKTASIYTVYMIPAIWIGNFLLVYLYRKIYVEKNKNYVLASIVAILVKAGVIFLGFNILTMVKVIPGQGKIFQALQLSMGLNQLVTATIAAVIVAGIVVGIKAKKGLYKKA